MLFGRRAARSADVPVGHQAATRRGKYGDAIQEIGGVEYGWAFIGRSQRGGTDNGKMKRLMRRHAFRFVSHVGLRIGPLNLRSQNPIDSQQTIDASRIRRGTRTDTVEMRDFRHRQ